MAGAVAPGELSRRADELFWLNRPTESIEMFGRAHRGWASVGDDDEAAMAAWRAFYEHWLVGEAAPAKGWLARARRHVPNADSIMAGWLAIADADVDAAAGRMGETLAHAQRAVVIGETLGHADLLSMARQTLGRYRVVSGDAEAGLALLDEAMVAVISNELSPLYTGWIYCNVIGTCIAVADIRRANEWSDAAMRWCESLKDGRLYPGLCRVYSAELAQLRGEWDRAERDARQACDDLHAFDARYSGAAHYVLGDLHRLRGRRADAAAEYRRARELGCEPQPGLAMLAVDEGDPEAALAALQTAAGSGGVLPRLRHLLALARVAREVGDGAALVAASAEAHGLATERAGDAATAWAEAVGAQLALSEGDSQAAVSSLRAALDAMVELGLTHEVAHLRLDLADAARAAGDELTAELEAELGAAALARFVAAPPTSGPLTDREVEVVRLVAEGMTNQQVAERLHLSAHTVARHLSNVNAKLGVSSRTGAVTAATRAGLLPQDGQF